MRRDAVLVTVGWWGGVCWEARGVVAACEGAWIDIMIELPSGVLRGELIIAVEEMVLQLVLRGNGIVAGRWILGLGAVGEGLGLLECEALQDEQ